MKNRSNFVRNFRSGTDQFWSIWISGLFLGEFVSDVGLNMGICYFDQFISFGLSLASLDFSRSKLKDIFGSSSN